MPGRERPLLGNRGIATTPSSTAVPSASSDSKKSLRSSSRNNSNNRRRGVQHNALDEDLHADKYVVQGQNNKRKRDLDRRAKDLDDEANQVADLSEIEAGLLDSKMAKRILQQSRLERTQRALVNNGGGEDSSASAKPRNNKNKLKVDGGVRNNNKNKNDDDDDENDDQDGHYVDEDGAVGLDDDDYDENAEDYSDHDSDFDDDDNNNEFYVGGGDDDDDDDEDPVEIEYSDTDSQAPSEMLEFADLGDEYELDEEEARLLGKFQPQAPTQSRNLADIIMEKIREKEEGQKAGGAETQSQADAEREGNHIDNRVRRVYIAIGRILRSYTAGKVPKAFKILPRVQNWEQLLLLTKPEGWSPHATYQATRIFAAALNERMAQRFYNAILLPIVHAYINDKKTLHPALYQAVRKALFKPIAFYKGFLLPLCDARECSLRESLIIGSILQKMHLQPIPTAVVIVKICEMPFSSPNVLFLRVLVDKKMSLPFQAIDALVAFFHRFAKAHRHDDKLPVLWHQALLSFCQRYKSEFKKEQIALLHEVCNKHFHQFITPEIRRELAAAVGAVSSYH